MKKNFLKYSVIILILLAFFTSNKSLASTSEYTIESYNIDMVVNENNTFDITERINVNFNVAKHGIYRKIPLKNIVRRSDGTSSINNVEITNIDVNEKYTVSRDGMYRIIKIGDKSRTYIGKHSYVIKYKYDIGKDPLKNADELYFNLIGDKWDARIDNITFKITMPKAFDKSLLGFSAGESGSSDSTNISYKVEGNVITGAYSGKLYPGQALTVRLTLPEGYFLPKNILKDNLFIVGTVSISIFISFLLWRKYGKNENIIERVEFYPPEGLNSAELGTIYFGDPNNKTIISLLIHLANEGYLKIEELNSEKDKFKIIKLKEYDSENEYEKIFFDGLFNPKDTLKEFLEIRQLTSTQNISEEEATKQVLERNKREEVTESQLTCEFYLTIEKVKEKLNDIQKKVFINDTEKIQKLIILINCFIWSITLYPVIIEYSEMFNIFFITAIILLIIFYCYFLCKNIVNNSKTSAKVFKSIAITILVGFLLLGTCLGINALARYLTTFIIGFIGNIIITLFAMNIPKRTPYGIEMLGRIRGFKNFLETVEKEKLEMLVQENPTYFYDILPYTYALGISNLWIKKFETIAIQEPNWYYSDLTNLKHCTVIDCMRNTMNSVSNSMTSTSSSGSSGNSSYSSSSGWGSSGGGFSGGGSGGGGGGSW